MVSPSSTVTPLVLCLTPSWMHRTSQRTESVNEWARGTRSSAFRVHVFSDQIAMPWGGGEPGGGSRERRGILRLSKGSQPKASSRALSGLVSLVHGRSHRLQDLVRCGVWEDFVDCCHSRCGGIIARRFFCKEESLEKKCDHLIGQAAT